jgi:hypothetical protein
MRWPFVSPLLLVALASTSCAHVEPAAPSSPAAGTAAWARLKAALPGTWTLAANEQAPPFIVSYKLISAGSALVEHWGAGTSHETETVFYPDHADLWLTHYCAQGNQPRLRVTDATADAIVFRFVDVTNREPDQAMLVEQTLRFAPDGSLEDTERYRAADGSDDTTTYRFTRVVP